MRLSIHRRSAAVWHIHSGDRMRSDEKWPTAGDSLATGSVTDPHAVAVVGVPLFAASLTPARCDLAPAAIRRTLARLSTYDVERDTDLREITICDLGDVPVAELLPGEAHSIVVASLSAAARGAVEAVMVLGGDNSVTRSGVHALWREHRRIGLLTLDAHFDLRHLEDGPHNGNPISGLLADGLPGSSIVQVGIQPFANSREYAADARGAGIRFFTAAESRQEGIAALVRRVLEDLASRVDAIYVDVDLDVLDRSLAPACAGSRPGGWSVPELREALLVCGRHAAVQMIDFVEIDPTKDQSDITVFCAAGAVMSFLSGLIERARNRGG